MPAGGQTTKKRESHLAQAMRHVNRQPSRPSVHPDSGTQGHRPAPPAPQNRRVAPPPRVSHRHGAAQSIAEGMRSVSVGRAVAAPARTGTRGRRVGTTARDLGLELASTLGAQRVNAGTRGGGGLAAIMPVLARELAGKGVVSGTLHTAANLAALPIAALQHLPAPIAAMNPLTLGAKLSGKVGRNAAKELVDIPASLVPSIYVPAAKLAHGDFGGAAHAVVDPLVDTVTHPIKSLTEHPLSTLLIAQGGIRGLDRAAGATVRGSRRAVGKDAGRHYAGPTDIKAGPGAAVQRNYSRGLVANALEKAAEAGRVPLTGQRRQRARRAGQGTAHELGTGRTRQVYVTPRQAAKAHLALVDHLQESGEQLHRTQQARVVHGERPQGRRARAAMKVLQDTNTAKYFVSREVRPGHVREDLTAVARRYVEERKKLNELRDSLTGDARTPEAIGAIESKLHENARSTAAVMQLLENPKALAVVERAGHEAVAGAVAQGVAQDTRLVDSGAMPPQRAKAKLVPALEAHTDTISGDGLRVPTEAGTARSVAEGAARGAVEAVGKARGPLRRAEQAVAFERGVHSVRSRQAEARAVAQHPKVVAARAARDHANAALVEARANIKRVATHPDSTHGHFANAHESVAIAEHRAIEARSAFSRASGEALRAVRHEGRVVASNAAKLARTEQEAALARRAHGEAVAAARGATKHAREVRAATSGQRLSREPWRVHADTGVEVTEAEARRLLEEAGVGHADNIGFVGERVKQRGAGAYARGPVRLEGERTPPQSKTGEASRGGIVHVTTQRVLEGPVRAASIADHAIAGARYLHELAFGDFRNIKDATRWAQAHHFEVREEGGAPVYVDSVGIEWVPAKLGAFFDTMETIRTRREFAGIEGQNAAAKLMTTALHDLGASKETGAGGVVLMPNEVVKRINEHGNLQNPTDAVKTLQRLSQQWRETVLLTSTRWLMGNGMELMFRLAMNGVTPFDYMLGVNWFKEGGHRVQRKPGLVAKVGGERELAQFRASTIGGGHLGAQMMWRLHRDASQLSPGTRLRRMNEGVDAVKENVIARRTIVGFWRMWKASWQGFNTFIERQGEYAMLGKAVKRDLHDFHRSSLKALGGAETAYADVARGLLNTPAQVRYAKWVHEVEGKYRGFSPSMKRMIRGWAPFLPWYVNALKFIYVTLPARHPVKTAALAGLYDGNEDRLTKEGQSLFGEGRLPLFLVGSIDKKGEGRIPLNRYLPTGALTSDPSQQVLPQGSFLGTLGGQDWKGGKLRNADGSTPNAGQLALIALYTGFESVTPFVSLARRVRESGGTGAADSTVFAPKTKKSGPRPDSNLGEGARKVFNPLHPIKPQAKSSGGGSKAAKGWGDGGGSGSSKPASSGSWGDPAKPKTGASSGGGWG